MFAAVSSALRSALDHAWDRDTCSTLIYIPVYYVTLASDETDFIESQLLTYI